MEKRCETSHIFLTKGGIFIAILWITTIGFVICLGMVGGVHFHFVRQALNVEDSIKVDRVPEGEDHTWNTD
ncbi:hypothetical protein [Bacillus methanolicus]|uniref:hypothetical protein n=1 Tax=Bacillus methanolicus TaxID=1471 RepID=UPI00025F2381|nr:hypothetical protein [Bacillus methanolicus]EIJ80833.1 hypothetical protein MGA3_11040 [Bacillus methanolicus MGA3]UQD51157.1 hypothetical protein C0971_03245 [Bacillus methanolicus]